MFGSKTTKATKTAAPKAKRAYTRKADKAGDTPIKGATDADRQVIDAAKESVRRDEQAKDERTTTADETPEAKTTAREQKKAAREQFEAGDKRAEPAEPASRVEAREAAKLSPEKLAVAQADNAGRLAARGF